VTGTVMRVAVLAMSALLCLATAAVADCGSSPEACTIPTGSYHAVLPPAADDAPPAVLFLHGWGGDGMGTLTNRGMVDALIARGYAVIAVDGSPRAGRSGRGWNFRADHQGRDDAAFAAAVADDAAVRFGLDRDRMILAGFSVGGSMVSYIACATPDAFSAYAPISGNFWRPHPEACAGPVRMFHIHGWTDGTVPLEGRRIRSAGVQQGDVFQAMEIWRATNGCTRSNPDGFDTVGDTQIRRWDESCAPGSSLAMALHPGGHKVPKGWADMMLDWFEGRDASQ
jgi:polyhydroxybutyrate depolymerase